MAAAQAGHLDVVEALIQAGARFGHKLSCQIFHKLSSEAKLQQPYFLIDAIYIAMLLLTYSDLGWDEHRENF